jgi:lysophospholipase L1-like esterase
VLRAINKLSVCITASKTMLASIPQIVSATHQTKGKFNAPAKPMVSTSPSESNVAVFSLATPGNSNAARICVYGDSLTAGFSPAAGSPCFEPYAKSLVSTLAAAGVSAQVVGCGLCGLTAVDMARGLDSPQLPDRFGRTGTGLSKLLADHGPFDLVIIMAGTNDLGEPHVSAQNALDSLKRMHEACWRAGSQTLALSIPESFVTGTLQYPEAKTKWNAINVELAAWAQMKPCTSFVNSAMLLSFDHAACVCGFWDADSLHFSAAGSGEFGRKLALLIASHRAFARTAREAAPLLEGHWDLARTSDITRRTMPVRAPSPSSIDGTSKQSFNNASIVAVSNCKEVSSAPSPPSSKQDTRDWFHSLTVFA